MRDASKARGAEHTGVFERRATQLAAMQRWPNALVVLRRALSMHTTVRLTAPNNWMLRPYFEAQASTVRWSSVYTLRFAAGSNSAEVSKAVDWSLGWGWGLGILLPADHRGHSFVALGFRRHHEGRPTVLQQVDGATIADAFPQVLDMLLLGVVIEL